MHTTIQSGRMSPNILLIGPSKSSTSASKSSPLMRSLNIRLNCALLMVRTLKIKAWLARRPDHHVHFTPTSASWINEVERSFVELSRKQIQRGVHTSVRQLKADIRAFIDRHNKNPKPFRWTKSADQILASVKRFCHKAQQTLCGEL